MGSVSHWIAGAARRLGVHVQRWRDPYVDFWRLAAERVRQAVDGGAFPSASIHAFKPQSDSLAEDKPCTPPVASISLFHEIAALLASYGFHVYRAWMKSGAPQPRPS